MSKLTWDYAIFVRLVQLGRYESLLGNLPILSPIGHCSRTCSAHISTKEGNRWAALNTAEIFKSSRNVQTRCAREH